ncbi:Rho-associated, coiled-coil containing protein kinase [Pseudoloma neurophilia]|uniref:non-specific serine/threonine protein kinase n=1 Tax=Pseudoloma neurophilia TaxID=146866 RepID=A0A0R0LWJ8_9MICR|nr:Rho-associated, coiled-coil containing protein kinase [Pseudoloma neurophilia]
MGENATNKETEKLDTFEKCNLTIEKINEKQHIIGQNFKKSSEIKSDVHVLQHLNFIDMNYLLDCADHLNVKSKMLPESIRHLSKMRSNIQHYKIIRSIGKGGYGQVYMVKKIQNIAKDPHSFKKNPLNDRDVDKELYFAMKVIKKQTIKDYAHLALFQNEKMALFLTRDCLYNLFMKECFQTNSNIHFIMEYCPVELINLLPINDTKILIFYISNLLLAIEEIHRLNIIHRDLKPDNIFIGWDGFIRLADYGSSCLAQNEKNDLSKSKNNMFSNFERRDSSSSFNRANSCVDRSTSSTFLMDKTSSSHEDALPGTIDYLSPEAFSHSICYLSDLWSFGVTIYEMVMDYTPFYNKSIYETQQNITNMKYNGLDVEKLATQEEMTDSGLPMNKNDKNIADRRQFFINLEDLLQKLFVSKEKRLTIEKIKRHPFFKSIDWLNFHDNKPPLFEEIANHQIDTQEEIVDLEETKQVDDTQFLGFSYDPMFSDVTVTFNTGCPQSHDEICEKYEKFKTDSLEECNAAKKFDSFEETVKKESVEFNSTEEIIKKEPVTFEKTPENVTLEQKSAVKDQLILQKDDNSSLMIKCLENELIALKEENQMLYLKYKDKKLFKESEIVKKLHFSTDTLSKKTKLLQSHLNKLVVAIADYKKRASEEKSKQQMVNNFENKFQIKTGNYFADMNMSNSLFKSQLNDSKHVFQISQSGLKPIQNTISSSETSDNPAISSISESTKNTESFKKLEKQVLSDKTPAPSEISRSSVPIETKYKSLKSENRKLHQIISKLKKVFLETEQQYTSLRQNIKEITSLNKNGLNNLNVIILQLRKELMDQKEQNLHSNEIVKNRMKILDQELTQKKKQMKLLENEKREMEYKLEKEIEIKYKMNKQIEKYKECLNKYKERKLKNESYSVRIDGKECVLTIDGEKLHLEERNDDHQSIKRKSNRPNLFNVQSSQFFQKTFDQKNENIKSYDLKNCFTVNLAKSETVLYKRVHVVKLIILKAGNQSKNIITIRRECHVIEKEITTEKLLLTKIRKLLPIQKDPKLYKMTEAQIEQCIKKIKILEDEMQQAKNSNNKNLEDESAPFSDVNSFSTTGSLKSDHSHDEQTGQFYFNGHVFVRQSISRYSSSGTDGFVSDNCFVCSEIFHSISIACTECGLSVHRQCYSQLWTCFTCKSIIEQIKNKDFMILKMKSAEEVKRLTNILKKE